MTLPAPPLVVITDRALARRPLRAVVEAAFAGGCRWLMVREKDLADDALAALVADIVSLARSVRALVSVGGNARVAVACGAGGVHLPQGFSVADARQCVGDDALVGVSAHSQAEAERAAEQGADYVTLSPLFATESKPGYGPALGLGGLARIASRAGIPVVALGGVTSENALDCLRAGASAVAVMGAVMRADDPAPAVAALVERLKCAPTARSRAGCRP